MEPELIILLLIIFGPAIAQWLGWGKKKGPTGKTVPPVERPGRPGTRPRPSRPSRTAEPESPPVPETPRTPGAEERPWWETPEHAQPDRSAPDPWRDDPARPQGPILESPEDLWEILTGERLPFPEPERPVETRPEPKPLPPDDPRSPRPEPVAEVVSLEGESLEATEISSEARHDEFHRLIDRPRPVVRRRGALERLGLEKRSDVRRAIVLAEVLGKPRSLERPDL